MPIGSKCGNVIGWNTFNRPLKPGKQFGSFDCCIDMLISLPPYGMEA